MVESVAEFSDGAESGGQEIAQRRAFRGDGLQRFDCAAEGVEKLRRGRVQFVRGVGECGNRGWPGVSGYNGVQLGDNFIEGGSPVSVDT